MSGWIYICAFIFAMLVVLRSLFNFCIKLFSTDPTTYVINREEKILLGVSLSYILTYFIY